MIDRDSFLAAGNRFLVGRDLLVVASRQFMTTRR